MQKIHLKQKPLMTYDQWVIEHAKNSMRGRIKRAKRKFKKAFIRTWNGTIDKILEITSSKRKTRLMITTGLAIIGLVACIGAACYISKNVNWYAMGTRSNHGTYSNGYVQALDGRVYEVQEEMQSRFKEGEIVTLHFDTKGTHTYSDDTFTIEGWGICE